MLFKKLFIALAAALCAASCSKDETPVNYADEVAGTYRGWTSAEFIYSPDTMVTADEQVVLTAAGEHVVTVGFTSATWGTFTCTATVAAQTGGYRLSGTGTTQMGMSAESLKTYDAAFAGTVDQAGNAAFVFEVPAVMGGLTISFTTGDAPAE